MTSRTRTPGRLVADPNRKPMRGPRQDRACGRGSGSEERRPPPPAVLGRSIGGNARWRGNNREPLRFIAFDLKSHLRDVEIGTHLGNQKGLARFRRAGVECAAVKAPARVASSAPSPRARKAVLTVRCARDQRVNREQKKSVGSEVDAAARDKQAPAMIASPPPHAEQPLHQVRRPEVAACHAVQSAAAVIACGNDGGSTPAMRLKFRQSFSKAGVPPTSPGAVRGPRPGADRRVCGRSPTKRRPGLLRARRKHQVREPSRSLCHARRRTRPSGRGAERADQDAACIEIRDGTAIREVGDASNLLRRELRRPAAGVERFWPRAVDRHECRPGAGPRPTPCSQTTSSPASDRKAVCRLSPMASEPALNLDPARVARRHSQHVGAAHVFKVVLPTASADAPLGRRAA